jgi:hypothetical protein
MFYLLLCFLNVAKTFFFVFDISHQILVSKIVLKRLVISDTYSPHSCDGNDMTKYRPSLVLVLIELNS